MKRASYSYTPSGMGGGSVCKSTYLTSIEILRKNYYRLSKEEEEIILKLAAKYKI